MYLVTQVFKSNLPTSAFPSRPLVSMTVDQEVEQVDCFYHIIKHRLVTLCRYNGEPASLASDPNSNFTVGMLAVGVMSHIFDDDALGKVVFIEHYLREK